MKKKKIDLPENFINRELSWLEFNERVLEEAQDNSNPVFERLRYAAIVSSNLDEFYMVRVASMWDLVQAKSENPDPAGLTPLETVQKIAERTHHMVEDQYQCYNRSLLPALKKLEMYFLKTSNLTNKQKDHIKDYYKRTVYPVLTPMVVDQSRPFPLILNRSLNVAVLLENKKDKEKAVFATVQVPSVLDRIVEIPGLKNTRSFVLLEDIIKLHLNTLFKGHRILAACSYRITRNADLGFDEEGAEDLLETIQESIKRRKWGTVVRLEVEHKADPRLIAELIEELELSDWGIYKVPGPLDLSFLSKVWAMPGYSAMKFPSVKAPLHAAFVEQDDIFETITRKDILLHNPYQSFDPVLELVQQAAQDPQVLAIKQTLYRVSGQSPIVEALAQAAENGKQVTAVVELKARFDEENNIIWAKRLEQAGCHVTYGLVGLKTHCKLLLIVRREHDGIKRYVHMGTGNYNDVTAQGYSDLGLFTTEPYFGTDVSSLFNMLSGYSQLGKMHKIDVAPVSLRKRLLALIKQESDNAKKNKKACIVAKLNSLVDPEIIKALYSASNAGVDIDLIVRGVCCLRPGIPGLSENITVRSIVGRFLEHSRIYLFHNSGDEQIFLSSADWMDRNLDRRVEVIFPIEDDDNCEEIKHILNAHLRDTEKARLLNSNGSYSRVDRRGKEQFNSQEYLYDRAQKQNWDANHPI
ncbi:MAG: RNA degradosome polyphosphate kinase [Acidobacteriota bacterium]